MPEITIDTGDNRPERHPLDKERVTIGRSRESDIFLPDQWLSRHHAEIVRKGDAFFVHDLGSKNGTLLNGEPVAGERALRDGDVITLGEHVLTLLGGGRRRRGGGAPRGHAHLRRPPSSRTSRPSLRSTPRSSSARTACWRS